MAYTYLEVVNDILNEMNEVLLTSSTFSSATNIQLSVKEFVNRAYFDINNPTFKWPWLAVASPQDDFYGNTYIETVAGQRWYLLKAGSADVNSDYGAIDWSHFSLTTEGVAGEVAPYTVRNLAYCEIEEWRDHYGTTEEVNKYNSESFSTPKRVIHSPDNRRFGVSPIPDKVYRIYFFAWTRPVRLTNFNDPLVLPDQYKPVLLSRTRYYAWQRKENAQQAAIADQEYKEGLKGMRQQEQGQTPDSITDNRVRF